jgi:hypothetical protein
MNEHFKADSENGPGRSGLNAKIARTTHIAGSKIASFGIVVDEFRNRNERGSNSILWFDIRTKTLAAGGGLLNRQH